MMSDRENTGGLAPEPLNPAVELPAPACAGLDDEISLDVIEGLAEAGTDPAVTAWSPMPPDESAALRSGAEVATASAPVLDAVRELTDLVGRRLDALQTLFERELRAEATRERVIDRLHAELQEYKHDLLLKIQRPIFVDLIELHDDIAKMIEARVPALPSAGDPDVAAGLRGLLESIQTAIEDILYRQGVEPFVHAAGEFDPRRQRAVSTVPTAEQALNKTLAARLRKGFAAGEKVIRPEIVTVYTWRPSPVAAED